METIIRIYMAFAVFCIAIVALPFALAGIAIEAIRDLFSLEER